MDFSTAAPIAGTLEEAQQIINELWLCCRELQQRIKALEERINKNSGNSSKPPSSDGLQKPKPKNLRQRSGKNPGGQKGHQRSVLEPCEHPDKIICHALNRCPHCDHLLQDVLPVNYESRQIFDIPPLKIEVTEHRADQKVCPGCKRTHTANFPEDVQQSTQYGDGVKGIAVYLNQYQFLPFERLQEFFVDILGHPISQGLLVKVNKQCYQNLAAVEAEIKHQLQNAANLHHDESGIRVNGKLHWCHVASTSQLTSYGIHAKRGKEGIEAMGILGQFQGRLVHDFFKPYFTYACRHGLCNAHHLRELKFIEEECHQPWAKSMANLLLAIKKQVNWHKEHNLCLLEERIKTYERCYDEILMMGFWHPDNIIKPVQTKKRSGYQKQSKAKNLLDRLRFYRQEVLAFMYDPLVPFTNNQAEQDIRMLKVKQKVSGCFRSDQGAQWFARIRSYISTAKKHGKNILDALQGAFAGNPFIPPAV